MFGEHLSVVSSEMRDLLHFPVPMSEPTHVVTSVVTQKTFILGWCPLVVECRASRKDCVQTGKERERLQRHICALEEDAAKSQLSTQVCVCLSVWCVRLCGLCEIYIYIYIYIHTHTHTQVKVKNISLKY